MAEEKNLNDIFVELAKARSAPVKIETDPAPFGAEEEAEGQLTVDVYNDGDAIVVQSAVAGVANPDELEINITNESVTVRGSREKSEKIADKDYYYQECFWGTFSRSIILPEEVDPDRSTGTLKNGVLTVRMPKLNRSKAKKLKVKFD
jgi:HSP20 family protein